MGFRSIKLFALLTLSFSLFGLLSLLLADKVLLSFEIPVLFSKFPLPLKLVVGLVSASLLLLSLQSLYCALSNRLISLLFHTFVALSIFLILLFPLTSKVSTFYLYPGSFVEVNGKRVALIEVLPSRDSFSLKVFIEKGGEREEGELSFNSPFNSSLGTIWFSGVGRGFGLPAFEFKLLEPTPLPLLLLLSGLLTVISGLFYTISSLKREGRDVYKERGERTPETYR